ncbi:GNAT family N-acetyltransferase [Mucilaginibacter pallidiroseus]|uniref:GNAT family N-acetyltransferase n=1 Tax=Mucilaginibacter pallidiroseus TaxID=2599295 RepID=A0A563U5I3_9SPHI|nr:GNAT family N-acetyltransferase [Mucilaginibacter pallidiroseus]
MAQSENLILRQFTHTDDAFIYDLLNTPTWQEFIGNFQINELADALAYINNVPLTYYTKHGFGPWLVALKTGEPIGMCGLFKRDYLDQPDLGFAFLPGYAGKGLAYESCLAVLDYAVKHFNLTTLYATTSQNNLRSQNLLKRCGFGFEGEITVNDMGRLSLYKLSLQKNNAAVI